MHFPKFKINVFRKIPWYKATLSSTHWIRILSSLQNCSNMGFRNDCKDRLNQNRDFPTETCWLLIIWIPFFLYIKVSGLLLASPIPVLGLVDIENVMPAPDMCVMINEYFLVRNLNSLLCVLINFYQKLLYLWICVSTMNTIILFSGKSCAKFMIHEKSWDYYPLISFSPQHIIFVFLNFEIKTSFNLNITKFLFQKIFMYCKKIIFWSLISKGDWILVLLLHPHVDHGDYLHPHSSSSQEAEVEDGQQTCGHLQPSGSYCWGNCLPWDGHCSYGGNWQVCWGSDSLPCHGHIS